MLTVFENLPYNALLRQCVQHSRTAARFRFDISEVSRSAAAGCREIVSHALMLPLVNTNPGSHTQLFYRFTLVYSDWEVLRCTKSGPKKGRAAVEKEVFEKMLELTD